MELNDDDVISIDPDLSFKVGGLLKVSRLYSALQDWFAKPANQWFHPSGVRCEILSIDGGGWKKGKIRFKVEFIPDELEVKQKLVSHNSASPLDDLRSTLDI